MAKKEKEVKPLNNKKSKKEEKNNQNPLTLLEKSGKIVERM